MDWCGSGRYDHLARRLNDIGIKVYGMDWTGEHLFPPFLVVMLEILYYHELLMRVCFDLIFIHVDDCVIVTLINWCQNLSPAITRNE